ncbi:MAG: TIGR01777 family oxidoreductase [Candidatus Aquicultor sp.]
MKVLVVGGTGFVGIPLCCELNRRGWDVAVLARTVTTAEHALGPGYTIIHWPDTSKIPKEALSGAKAIINLAGESIGDKRWTNRRKEQILSSRVLTTRRIVDAMRDLEEKPEVLVNASAIGYYGPHTDEKLCEDEPNGTDFLANVTKAWEDEAAKAEALGVRVVMVRIGVVLENGGVLARMITPFKLYIGGPVGSGRQWFSWVHRDDLVGIIIAAIENDRLRGPVNATAPTPITMKEFSKQLGRALSRPSWLPLPGFILKIALGEMSDMLLTGQRVLPCKALGAGYIFKYETAEAALSTILSYQRTRSWARAAG